MNIDLSTTACYKTTFFLGGVTFNVRSDDEQFCAMLRALYCSTVGRGSGVTVYVSVRQQNSTCNLPYFRAVGDQVSVRFGEDLLFMNLSHKMAIAVVNKSTGADVERWRTVFLPTMLGVLGPAAGIVPFHSACIRKGDVGFLLAGLSGAGKSTLSVALGLQGYELISDDWTYVSAEESLTAYGAGVPVKLLPDAVEHFPQLRGAKVGTSLNGELAFEVGAKECFSISTANVCTPQAMFILKRRERPGWEIEAICSENVRRFFKSSSERLPTDLAHISRIRDHAIAAVSSLPAFLFQYGGTPCEGATFLSEAIEEVTCAMKVA